MTPGRYYKTVVLPSLNNCFEASTVNEVADHMDIDKPTETSAVDFDHMDIDGTTELNTNVTHSGDNTFGCYPVSINRQDTKGCPSCK